MLAIGKLAVNILAIKTFLFNISLIVFIFVLVKIAMQG